ncbi:Disease resistance protein RPM1 [Camellia lanceoleosa]|uniref:Disease resistance protein RPM1 n=1 Tax=Camellia lanceoleosa TaxID=1840588 RepID=A0ACC0IS79_9ERIC|nr:Disease resistance protein RPM1 [Camellia lanceoleosa]
MSIQSTGRELQPWNWKDMLKLRSLLVFVVKEIASPLGLQLLRVLDLEDAPIEVLPKELVDLFNLRYLNLKGTRVKELPKSIGRLCNLNTLDISDSKIEVLPTGITELRNLRHLMMYHCDYGILDDFHYGRGTTTPSNICKLKNLQVLAGIKAQADLIKLIRNMTQLKRIGITQVREVDEEDLCTAIQNMSLIHYLFVMVIDEDEYLRMDALSSTPPHYLKECLFMTLKARGGNGEGRRSDVEMAKGGEARWNAIDLGTSTLISSNKVEMAKGGEARWNAIDLGTSTLISSNKLRMRHHTS